MDVQFEIDRSIRRQIRRISMMARVATDRVMALHTLPSGICYCGADMDDHSGWENHAPTEMLMDKSGWYDPIGVDEWADPKNGYGMMEL